MRILIHTKSNHTMQSVKVNNNLFFKSSKCFRDKHWGILMIQFHTNLLLSQMQINNMRQF